MTAGLLLASVVCVVYVDSASIADPSGECAAVLFVPGSTVRGSDLMLSLRLIIDSFFFCMSRHTVMV